MREAVVFQHNSLFDLIKHPGKPGGWTTSAPQIHVRIILKHFTVPIDAIDDGARGSASFNIERLTGPWAVGNDQQRPRAG